MFTAEFYRTPGAKDKKPRKKRKKSRIETQVQKRIDRAKRPFQEDPGILGRAIEYVKDNPGKAFMTALGTTALVATQGKKIAKGLEGIVGADISTVLQKNKRYQQLVKSISEMKERIALKGYQARKDIDLAQQKAIATEQERIAKAAKEAAEAAEREAKAKGYKPRTKKVNPNKAKSPRIPATSYAPGPPTSASKPLPKQRGGGKTGASETSGVYRPKTRTGPKKKGRAREEYTFSPVLSEFARTPGAKDKRKRKQRRKTRIEASVQRKAETIKRMFEPEPTRIEKVIDYVKRNPLKALGAVGGTLYGAHLMKNRFKELVRDVDWLRGKRGDYVAPVEMGSSDLLAEFARTRGAKDKRKRKKRFRRGLRVRAIDKDKIKRIGESEVVQDTGAKSEINPKVKEAYLKAQTFRSRINPIIGGIREVRSTANMLGRMSKWKDNSKLSNFNEYSDWPIVEALTGQQIKGRGGIVKILAHVLGTEQTYGLEYNPKEYDSSKRYYERYANLLADNQGNLKRAKDVGGKPDIHKSQVKGQQGIEAKKGKVGGSLLTRQYSMTRGNIANFAEEKESRIARLRKRFHKLMSRSKAYAGKKYGEAGKYVKEKAPKVKAYAGKKYRQAKEGVKKAELGRKAGMTALKGAYHTGRYAEKAAQAKKRMMGD